jgi:hypothetical protein
VCITVGIGGGVEIIPKYKAMAEKRIKEESMIQTFDFGDIA